MLLDLAPAPGALRIGAPIRGPDLQIDGRLLADFGNFDARAEIGDLPVRHLARAGPDHQGAQPLRPPPRIVQSRKAAAGDTKQMEAVELEMIGERIEVAGDRSRLRPG